MSKKIQKVLFFFLLLLIPFFSKAIKIESNILNDSSKVVQSNGYINPIEYTWNYTWDLTSDDMGESIIIDQNDEIFVLGGTEPSYDAIYLSKFNKYCILEWEVIWGESYNIRPFDMCMDKDGNIYVVAEGTRSYLVKFNGSGHCEWFKSYSRVGSDHFSAIAIDSFNHIYITGRKEIDGREDVRLVKLYENGTQIWDKTWGDGNVADQGGNDIIIDSNNFIYITGYDYSIRDIVLIKFDSMGDSIWETSWGTGFSYYDEGWTINLDKKNNLYVGVILNRYGSPNVSIVKFNSSGNYLWNVTWGGNSHEYMYDIAINSENEILCTGNTLSYGAGGYDAFLLRITDQGQLLDNKTLGYEDSDFGKGVTVDSANRIFLTGRFRIGGRNNFFLARYEPWPIIEISLPKLYQNYAEKAPNFSISITDLDLNSTWYSINKGLNYTFSGMSGTINQTEWDKYEDGSVVIRFYAKSNNGYLSFKDIEIQKDTIKPEITIISPTPNQLFGNKTVDFEISVEELNLDSKWYSLNNGKNYTFTGMSGTINQAAWILVTMEL